jgi:hypothetical protein
MLRERGHFWQSRPSLFLVASSVFGLTVATILGLVGILMPPLSAPPLLAVASTGLAWFACLDWLKVWLFRTLDLR